MAGKYIFKSDRREFKRKHETFIERVTSRMSVDAEIMLKTSGLMPVDQGIMKSSTRAVKDSRGKWRTVIGVGYAAVQEAGVRLSGPGAPTQPFSNYTTPGTGPHFFETTISNILRNRDTYIKEAKQVAGL